MREPVHVLDRNAAYLRPLKRADHDLVSGGIFSAHIGWVTKGNAKAFALSDGVEVGTLMIPKVLACWIDDMTGPCPQMLFQKLSAASLDEADVLRLLAKDRWKLRFLRKLFDLRFRQSAQGK